jgi:hypothetical protein
MNKFLTVGDPVEVLCEELEMIRRLCPNSPPNHYGWVHEIRKDGTIVVQFPITQHSQVVPYPPNKVVRRDGPRWKGANEEYTEHLEAEIVQLKTRIAALKVERDGARAANRALIAQRGELWAEVRTLKSYIVKIEADKSVLRRRLETKNGRLIGERIAELEAKIVLLMGEIERAKEE